MNVETLREFVRRQPFEPFVIRMSNGEVHEILHPECLAIGKNRVVVTDPDTDRTVYCALIHINTVEPLEAA
ncbi:MAG: hypothetical protein ACKOEM_02480 [Planctomycetia bacterium]